jgi:hypothetical protein
MRDRSGNQIRDGGVKLAGNGEGGRWSQRGPGGGAWQWAGRAVRHGDGGTADRLSLVATAAQVRVYGFFQTYQIWSSTGAIVEPDIEVVRGGG